MRMTSRMTRCVGGAMIVACAAIGIPAVAMATPARPAAVQGCSASDLDIWAGVPSNQGMEQFSYQIELSNISARPCTLYGFPGVSAISGTGRQLGDAAGRGAGKAELITLRYGQTAHFTLDIIDVTIFPPSSCDQVGASGLRIYAPGDRSAQFVNLPVEVCGKAGQPYMNVTTTLNGAGVPDLA
jgi:hypothetical protein